MLKPNSEFRKEAREALAGNWAMAAVTTLVYVGVSAQQLKGIFPEFVSYDDYTERYAVGYDQLGTAVAIVGIKELYARFRPVENKVKALEGRVRNLQARLDNAYREIFILKEGKEEVA